MQSLSHFAQIEVVDFSALSEVVIEDVAEEKSLAEAAGPADRNRKLTVDCLGYSWHMHIWRPVLVGKMDVIVVAALPILVRPAP